MIRIHHYTKIRKRWLHLYINMYAAGSLNAGIWGKENAWKEMAPTRLQLGKVIAMNRVTNKLKESRFSGNILCLQQHVPPPLAYLLADSLHSHLYISMRIWIPVSIVFNGSYSQISLLQVAAQTRIAHSSPEVIQNSSSQSLVQPANGWTRTQLMSLCNFRKCYGKGVGRKLYVGMHPWSVWYSMEFGLPENARLFIWWTARAALVWADLLLIYLLPGREPWVYRASVNALVTAELAEGMGRNV